MSRRLGSDEDGTCLDCEADEHGTIVDGRCLCCGRAV